MNINAALNNKKLNNHNILRLEKNQLKTGKL